MNALLILAHPNPQSFNAAVARTIEEEFVNRGNQVRVKDLYAMNWNPILSQSDLKSLHSGRVPDDIQQEQADIIWADYVVMVAPVWWYSVPAILKGYIDRVFTVGFAYKYTSTGPLGLLKGKKGLAVTTSGTNRQDAEFGGMLATLERSLIGVFGFSGFQDKQLHNLFAVTTVGDQERRLMLDEIRDLVKNYF